VAFAALSKCSRCSTAVATTKAPTLRPTRRPVCADEADKIRHATEDGWTPANAFETGVGRFWKITSAHPYMRAKLELIHALSTIPSRSAIKAALVEARDCLRLCRKR
jgi:hypothetical protein